MAFVLLIVVMPLSFLPSCNSDKKDLIEVIFDPQTSYTLKETNVETLVSDSGVTRYKIIAATRMVFDKAAEPYWFFPDGVYIEKFDTALNIVARIKADTAYSYRRRKLLEAKGNVDITNQEGERFETSQIFFDEQKNIIYSDSFIRITGKDDFINTGAGGFQSNADMSEYFIKDASMEMTVETQRRTHVADTLPADSIHQSTIQMQQTVHESDASLRIP